MFCILRLLGRNDRLELMPGHYCSIMCSHCFMRIRELVLYLCAKASSLVFTLITLVEEILHIITKRSEVGRFCNKAQKCQSDEMLTSVNMFNNQYLIRIMEIALLHEGYLVIVFGFDNCLQSVLGYLLCLLCRFSFQGKNLKSWWVITQIKIRSSLSAWQQLW